MNLTVKDKQYGRVPIFLGALVISIFIGIFYYGSATAANIINMGVYKTGTDLEVNTMWAYEAYEIRIKIQNDCLAYGFNMALRVYNSALPGFKVGWEWLDQPNGCYDAAYVTMVPGCRMNPGPTCYPIWDLYWDIVERSVDGLEIDTIGLQGGSMSGTFPPGSLEHMISLHFRAWPTTDTDGVIWVDYGLIPPNTDWELCGVPTYDEGVNLPGLNVIDRGWLCGDVNSDGIVNIFDVTFLISYLYLEGTAPNPLASADVNGDSAINIFDITALISFLYLDGTPPNCP